MNLAVSIPVIRPRESLAARLARMRPRAEMAVDVLLPDRRPRELLITQVTRPLGLGHRLSFRRRHKLGRTPAQLGVVGVVVLDVSVAVLVGREPERHDRTAPVGALEGPVVPVGVFLQLFFGFEPFVEVVACVAGALVEAGAVDFEEPGGEGWVGWGEAGGKVGYGCADLFEGGGEVGEADFVAFFEVFFVVLADVCPEFEEGVVEGGVF